jgi:hypothetical protein
VGGACSTKNAYKILVGKLEGKRSLERPRHRLEDNIAMDFRDTEWEGVYLIHGSGQVPVVCSCEYGNEPSRSIKGGKFLDRVTFKFSRRTVLHGVSYM